MTASPPRRRARGFNQPRNDHEAGAVSINYSRITSTRSTFTIGHGHGRGPGRRSGRAGAPSGFQLDATVTAGATIRLATAFAHWSGWQLVRQRFLRNRTRLKLLTGLDFCQSEPKVLWDWFRLQRNGRAEARVCAIAGFHPKVWIIEPRRGEPFALVGSGNLSAGGLRSNVECFLYTDRFNDVGDLLSWFDGLFNDPNISTRLRPGDIEEYEVHFNAAQKALATARRREKKARQALKIDAGFPASAIAKARRYFRSAQWERDKKIWYPGRRRISEALRYPTFNFNKDDWDRFYRERTMGRLIEVHKNRVFRQRRHLQAGLRHLMDEKITIESRLGMILAERGRVKGFGLNSALKILAAYRPTRWPVYNGAVREALEQLGYTHTVRRDGQGYEQFAEDVREFAHVVRPPQPTMLALDAFFRSFTRGYETG